MSHAIFESQYAAIKRTCFARQSAEEANNSDGDSSSAAGGCRQYFIRNSDSSDISGHGSSDASSFDSSGAGAESAGDSPQGKSDVVQSRQDGGFYPNRGRGAQNERNRDIRGNWTGSAVVEGPSGVSTGRLTKAKVRWAVTPRFKA
jgi:hypothetical protein